MEEKDLLEMPIEIINPGNGLPEAPPCSPFISAPPCHGEDVSGGGGGICDPGYGCGTYKGFPWAGLFP